VASCRLDDWRRDADSNENVCTVTALRVPFVAASMRECVMGVKLTGKCRSPIICIQCRDGESMALQLRSSICPYNVVLRHNTVLQRFKLYISKVWLQQFGNGKESNFR
jgi:hypothetical protein